MISILAIALVFGLIIFVHESGHFAVAKMFGIKVERFSFGLGREIFGKTIGETRYCLAWVPLGGEVRMAGEYPEDIPDEKAEPDPREFYAKPWYKRIAVVFAGPTMNYLSACIIFSALTFKFGEPSISKEPLIGETINGKPAQATGLLPGDKILSVNGESVNSWEETASKIRSSRQGEPLLLKITRDNKELGFKIIPEFDQNLKANIIGIGPMTEFKKVSLTGAITAGLRETAHWTVYTLSYLAAKIYKRERPDLAGPIGIVQVLNKAVHAGFHDLLYLVGLISVGVGLFNFLPIPMLDGGHAAIFALEGIIRKRPSRKIIQYVNSVGLSILICILALATYNDIQRLRTSKPAQKHVTHVYQGTN